MSRNPEPFWREVGPSRVEIVYPGHRGASSRVVVVDSVSSAKTILEGAPSERVDPSLYGGTFEMFFVSQVRFMGVRIENRSPRPANYRVHGEFIKDDRVGVVNARSIETIEFKLSPRCKLATLEMEGSRVASWHRNALSVPEPSAELV